MFTRSRTEANSTALPGRPRSETARQAILGAALQLAQKYGYQHVTLKAIAESAKVGRQTIYRWWSTKGALFLELLVEILDESAISLPERLDLDTFLCAIFKLVREKTGLITISLLLEAQHDPALLLRLREIFGKRQMLFKSVVEHTAAKRQQKFRVPVDIVIEMLAGVIWYRVIQENAPLNDALAHTLTRAVYGLME